MGSIEEGAQFNVVDKGIKGDIDFALENKRYRATVILIYSGIDAMAFLDMPEQQQSVVKRDFVQWVDRYLTLPGSIQLSGTEYYAARCGMVHAYGFESDISRRGNCRLITYRSHGDPAIAFHPALGNEVAIVSLRAFRDAFFDGIYRFLLAAYSDPVKQPIVTRRLEDMAHVFVE